MNAVRLRLQDVPPLEIPISFFLTAPLALAAAGTLVFIGGADVLTSRWMPFTLVVTHLGTLGFISMLMLGATYQMLAVVVGSPIPWPRSAHGVHVLFTLGVAGFCWGVATGNPSVVFVAIAVLTFGVFLFVVPVGIALWRAPSLNETVFGIRAAVGFFFLTAVAGIWMAHGFSGMNFPGSRLLWSQAHLCVALIGWVGGLIAAVSWQVLPMFYLARRPPVAIKWTVQILAALGAIGPVLILGVDYFNLLGENPPPLEPAAAAAVAPGILAVWVLHPAVSVWSLSKRRRKRADGSLYFWQAGLVMAPLTALAAAAAWSLDAPHWDILFGWLALWGWVGMIMHGMLTRIVPFLVWLHRFAPLVGKMRVPSIKKLHPDSLTRRGFVLHLCSLLLGVVAILTASDLLCKLAGLSLILTAASIAHLLVHVLRQRPPAELVASSGRDLHSTGANSNRYDAVAYSRPEPHGLWGRAFRPFFLGAAIYAALAIPSWTGIWLGAAPAPGWLLPMWWHGHEMMFGFVTAAIAGFLLTASPVWTGGPALSGAPLAALFALWVAGRVAFASAGVLPAWLVAAVDIAFLPAVAGVVVRTLWGSGQRRNYAIVGILIVLATANAAMHAEALDLVSGTAGRALRFAVDGVVVLILVIGGRITPAFTQNAFRQRGIERTLGSWPWLNALVIGAAGTLAFASLLTAGLQTTGILAVIAGLAAAARLAGWQTWHTRSDPLLWSLHAGSAWIAIGLLLVGASNLGAPIPAAAGLHALTAGAMGATILAVMTRVSLGHTGRPLELPDRVVWCFALVHGAALARVAAPFVGGDGQRTLLLASGVAWAAAFGLFAVYYWRILIMPRPDGGPG
ncbi:MAG: NnrS family protein [Deltaproteobacteria bacterium]|nr:NnrS family protein [Deltaproteobacteria bacterium]